MRECARMRVNEKDINNNIQKKDIRVIDISVSKQ